MTIFLSRHGRTDWSARGLYAGVSDIELDEEGHRQAGLLADWAAAAELTAVVASPLVRAVQTATGAARAAGVPLRTDPRLRELDFGVAEGRPRSDLDPEVVRAFEADPVGSFLPGGEDPVKAIARVTECLTELGSAGRVLVVAHNTILRLALCGLLGIPPVDYRRRLPLFEHATVTELTAGPSGMALRRFNVPLGR
ncbi:putative phosphoglycerate mutase GpmB [Microtetraspora sp. NBRC 13810]|uniref:histidine phosphatase family protein n=1 Tax=Microtetraspora sp. NBRC 13810 TaxID=3030990 RepID=UPI0024A12294|nr:histidine phosphatase family protein [Microtetraspora sp. NBRC 13810]GLW12057.1 putative phosphoglycerate mutase GpmB [Microtetraspora sp. NBRC 13810]